MGELTWAYDQYNTTAKDSLTYSDYYHGKQTLMLSDEANKLFGKLFGHIRYNVCATVVDTLAARLIVDGFDAESDATQEYLTELQAKQRLQTLYSRTHKEAAKSGDAYVMVWPQDSGEPGIYLQPTGAITVRYDTDGDLPKIVEAVKFWYYGNPTKRGSYIGRLTHYTPKLVRRFIKETGTVPQFPEELSGWQPYSDQPEFANPWGRIPLYRFANSLDSELGQSELRDVLPLQDALNKTLVDTLIGAEYQGLQQRWVSGLDLDVDPATGERRMPFKAGGHRLWVSPSPEASFGQFDQADLTQLTAFMTAIEQRVARVSRTPYHLFALESGNFPSGEALKTAEAPLAEKVQERQTIWGDTWEDVMTEVLMQANKPVETLRTIWKETGAHSAKEQTEIALMKLDLGVSKTKLRQELGYTADEITEMDEENAADSRNQTENALRSFNAGV